MAEISGLSVKVSAAVAGFNASMSRAQDSAGDLALSLRRLDFATGKAERGIDSAGRSATTTALQFSGLSFASSLLTTNIFGLSGALWLALIPAIAVLSTALAPLVAGLAGFVAIAGAIGGIGIVGAMGAIATNTEDLKENFTGMVNTLKEELAPAFDLATEVLVIFMEDIEDVADQLLPSEQAMSRLAGNFAALGSALIELLPAFSQLATELALRFLPPFVTFARSVLPRVPGMVRTLANSFSDILPILLGFGRWFMDISPDLYDFGLTVLKEVANGLGVVGDAISEVLDIGASSDSLEEFLRRMITSASNWLKNKGLPMISGLASDILGQLSTYFEEGGSDELSTVVSSFMGGLADALKTVTDEDTQSVVGEVKTILAGILSGVADALQSPEAGALGTQIARVAGSTIGIVMAELMEVARSDEFALEIAALSKAIAAGLAKGITIATANALDEITLADVARTIGGGPSATLAAAAQKEMSQRANVDPNRFDATSNDGAQVPGTNFTIEVTGDTGVIEDIAVTKIDEEQRAVRRRQGRGRGN